MGFGEEGVGVGRGWGWGGGGEGGGERERGKGGREMRWVFGGFEQGFRVILFGWEASLGRTTGAGLF